MANMEPSVLDGLPPELLLHIFSFLPARVLWKTVRRVCRHFYAILSDQNKFWNLRFQRTFPAVSYPIRLTEGDVHWARRCCVVKKEWERWVGRRENRLEGPDYLLPNGHIATVDAVHLIGPDARLCLSGSRDRTITIWDLDQLPPRTSQYQGVSHDTTEIANATRVYTQEQAHKGWIWSVTSVGRDVVYSGGWDCDVNRWQLRPTGLEPVSSARLNAAVLCVIAERDLVLASSFDNRVTLLDPRDQHTQIAQLNCHRGPVISMVKGWDDCPYLFTCGQDKRILCIDRRTWTPVAHRTFPSYAHSLCFAENQLWAGTQTGTLALLDHYSDHLETIVERAVAPSRTVVHQVKHSLAATVCISKDRRLRVFWPGTNLSLLIQSEPFAAEPSRFDYLNGNLAIGFGDGSVGIWHDRLLPENMTIDTG